jgi:hypothetical protein
VREIIEAIGLAFGTVDTKSSALFNAVMVLLSTTQFQLWCVATENLYMFTMTSSILFHCWCDVWTCAYHARWSNKQGFMCVFCILSHVMW